MRVFDIVAPVVAFFTFTAVAAIPGPALNKRINKPSVPLMPRQLPPEATGVKTIITPNGNITYKEPGKEGICETTPGVNSYAGFVNLAPDVHVFFWFFESRRDPANDPLTLWLNGGPGSDSLIGMTEGELQNESPAKHGLTERELGPCNISDDLVTHLNPYSFNEVSNFIFLSQPVGVGFSYGSQVGVNIYISYYIYSHRARVWGTKILIP
jgi:hypothetical protein